MVILEQATIFEIHKKAMEIGLHRRRDALLQGLPVGFVGSLPIRQDESSQLFSDLGELNKQVNLVIAGGASPFLSWLKAATFFSSQYPTHQAFFSDLARTVENKATANGAQPGENAHAIGDQTHLPEKIIGSDDLLPASFLDGALRTARSVVRLVIPVYRGSQAVHDHSGKVLVGFGTAWLIGSRHLLTNHHVIVMREPGAVPPTPDEFRLQGENGVAEFDFVSEQMPPSRTIRVAAIRATDKMLDYALLELKETVADRSPLVLAQTPLAVDPNRPAAVNIVQHPRGAAKQLALRNNLVAAVEGPNLAYFTDTDYGSSGSPVADDTWRVVALHKAHSRRQGPMDYQGKTTAWVNVGTPIHLIVEHIKAQSAELWNQVGATFG